jgi:hypothetical protein
MNFIADEPLATERKLAPLYQLPISGDWITLADIKMVSVSRSSEYGGTIYPAQVMVVVVAPPVHSPFSTSTGEAYLSIKCVSDEQAREIRDQIAAARNQLK